MESTEAGDESAPTNLRLTFNITYIYRGHDFTSTAASRNTFQSKILLHSNCNLNLELRSMAFFDELNNCLCNAGICNSLIKKRKDHSNQSGGQECAECNAIEIPILKIE